MSDCETVPLEPIELCEDDYDLWLELKRVMGRRKLISKAALWHALGKISKIRRLIALGLLTPEGKKDILRITGRYIIEGSRIFTGSDSFDDNDDNDDDRSDILKPSDKKPKSPDFGRARKEAVLETLSPEERELLSELVDNTKWTDIPGISSLSPHYYQLSVLSGKSRGIDALMQKLGIKFDPSYQAYRLPHYVRSWVSRQKKGQ